MLLALVMLALGIFFSAVSGPNPSSNKQAQATANATKVALEQYFHEYAQLPLNNGKPDTLLDTPETVDPVMATLTGDPENNPKELVFLEARQDDLGRVRDPWDQPFRILLDTNFNNAMTLPNGERHKGRVAVWSIGKNGKDEFGGGDDISTLK